MTEICYAYRRYSSKRQGKGDSEERQDLNAETAAERKGWLLDTTLDLFDRGVSAFRGKNSLTGKLSKFLGYVKEGTVRPGSILMVEALDRLSRSQLDDAMTLTRDLLRSGVKLYDIQDDCLYTAADLNSPMKLMLLIVKYSEAHQGSARKSGFATRQWNKAREQLGERKLSVCRPNWLDGLSKDKKSFLVNEDKKKIVQRMFSLCISGMGCVTIAQTLNAEGLRLTSRVLSTTAVHNILTSRAVLGEYQPHKKEVVDVDGEQVYKRLPIGDPVPDYYPRIIDDHVFSDAQASLAKRSFAKGRSTARTWYLFARMMFNAKDGGLLVFMSAKKQEKTKCVRSQLSVSGKPGADCRRYNYTAIEAAVLQHMSELDVASVFPDVAGAQQARLSALRTRLDGLKAGIANTQALIVTDPLEPAYLATLRQLVGERNKVSAEYDALNAATISPDADQLRSVQELLREAPGGFNPTDEATRQRLRGAIQRIVTEIWALKIGRGKDAWYVVQIWYKGGATRVVQFGPGVACSSYTLVPGLETFLGDLRKYREPGYRDNFTRLEEELLSLG